MQELLSAKMTDPAEADKFLAPMTTADFDYDAAAHLLRRCCMAADPETVRQAVSDGPRQTVDRLVSPPPPLPLPALANALREQRIRFNRERSGLDAQAMRQRRARYLDASVQLEADALADWGQRLIDAATAAQEHFVMFLLNVAVVSERKVRDPLAILDYLALLRANSGEPYPMLLKAVSRSAAMIRYLDLDRSQAGRPNENFARELMELFVLGEGNYAESDVKAAARAFTGYRHDGERFQLRAGQQDRSPKTLFGRTGTFTGDAVIDLLFTQPAARTYLPGELIRHYLTVDERSIALSRPVRNALGERWAARGFSLRELRRTLFLARGFYAAEYRCNHIKSPLQLLFGSLQQLGLAVNPSPRFLRRALSNMGQDPIAPPTVRGWPGGRTWINASTLAARRQIVGLWFQPLRMQSLNADEVRMFEAAAGKGPFRVSAELLQPFRGGEPLDAAQRMATSFLAAPPPEPFLALLAAGLRSGATRATLMTLLQTPEYQLC